jgi:hypothetical protein
LILIHKIAATKGKFLARSLTSKVLGSLGIYAKRNNRLGAIEIMSKYSVVHSLTRNGFYFVGAINDMELDYIELIEGDWYLGVLSNENLLIAFNHSIGWGLKCHGEADIENRWNSTKKLIRTALKATPIAA